MGMFTVRAVASTITRLPAGAIAGAIGSRRLMIGVIVLELLAILGLGGTGRPDLLVLLLALEGIAFGGYLTSAHAFIAEHTVPETRGAALGFYSTAGSVGAIAAPVGLGFVAEIWGFAAVFVVTAGLIFVGLLTLVMISGADSRSEQWERVLVQGQRLGIGAIRSMNYGQFKVTSFDRV